MNSNKAFKWIFIYGPPRTGSTYLLRQIRNHSIHSVSDWGLGLILKPFISMPGGIDKKKFLEDLRRNLLSRSKRNAGGHFDLVLKAANGNLEEFECYKEMFGLPERIIFTIREPSGYMSSAHKKFSRKNTFSPAKILPENDDIVSFDWWRDFRLLRFAKYEKLSFFPSTTQIQQRRNREISIQEVPRQIIW